MTTLAQAALVLGNWLNNYTPYHNRYVTASIEKEGGLFDIVTFYYDGQYEVQEIDADKAYDYKPLSHWLILANQDMGSR